ncbi:hypothetical protein K8I61_17280 [bacterium]|nr:hypothetical protein [bacterium]
MASLKRAFGQIIEDAVPGLEAFADDAANRKSKYPCVDVAQNGHRSIRRFAGRTSYYKKDESGKPTHAVKHSTVATTLTFTVKAAGTKELSSEDRCLDLRNAVYAKLAVLQAQGALSIADPKTDEDLNVIRLAVTGMTDPAVDTTGEPIVHAASVEAEVQFREIIERPMNTFIKSAKVVHEVIHVGT